MFEAFSVMLVLAFKMSFLIENDSTKRALFLL